MSQQRIPAVWMRGGTSKGLFFHAHDLPSDPQARDALLLRAMGSPDPYGKQIDGLGGATSSTSKIVIIQPSTRDDCDIDYLFGHVSISDPVIDYSGNCGNLTAAAAVFAIEESLVPTKPQRTEVAIWQQNIGKKIIATVPCDSAEVQVEDAFRIAGVAFDGAEIKLQFVNPAGSGETPLLPTGQVTETLSIAEIGTVDVSLINAGNPTVFVRAADFDLDATESSQEIENNTALMNTLEQIRAHAAVAMGLATTAGDATANRPATPKIALVGPPKAYRCSDGSKIEADQIDVLVRLLSMGKPHHAITGTGTIAAAVSAAMARSVVQSQLNPRHKPDVLRLGHASGITTASADVFEDNGRWVINCVQMSRSARRLMEGNVLIPCN